MLLTEKKVRGPQMPRNERYTDAGMSTAKNSKGKERQRDEPMDVDENDDMPMDIDQEEKEPSQEEIQKMIRSGNFLEARKWVFSEGALKVLQNGQYIFYLVVSSH